MCGLVSIHSSGVPLTEYEARLDVMLDAIAHRGPDGRGRRHVPGSVLQGHVRLAIIDPENGQQPMVTRDGRFSIVFNGAIYNYIEVRRSLEDRGVRFSTSSDTEVLLQVLALDGTAAIPALNGMYAFVFHDRDTGRWIAARDPFGIKPLYMSRLGTELAFASEIKAILSSGLRSPRMDPTALAQYVAFQFTLGRRTMYDGIDRIPPATWLEGRGAEILREHRFWTPNQEIDIESEEQAAELVRSILDDTMRLQLRSDVPVGSSLSGGLDSSVVCSLAARELGTPLPAFHGRFDAGRSFDESQYAEALARSIGSELHVVTPTPADFVNAMPEIIRLLDEPVAGPGSFPQFMVSRRAASDVKVMLGGQGGDEVFGGYRDI